jgi:hypothetical protein
MPSLLSQHAGEEGGDGAAQSAEHEANAASPVSLRLMHVEQEAAARVCNHVELASSMSSDSPRVVSNEPQRLDDNTSMPKLPPRRCGLSDIVTSIQFAEIEEHEEPIGDSQPMPLKDKQWCKDDMEVEFVPRLQQLGQSQVEQHAVGLQASNELEAGASTVGHA